MFKLVPPKIVQTNRLPLLIGIIVLMLVMGMFMYKTQTNQQKLRVQSKPHQSFDVTSRARTEGWFNEDKFKNIKFNSIQSLNKPTEREIESQIISSQEVDLKKKEIEDEYSTRLEIKKMEDKDRIEDKKLELEAMRSPLSIEPPSFPGTAKAGQKKGGGGSELSNSLDGLLNSVKSMVGNTRFPSMPAIGAQPNVDLNNQDMKMSFLKRREADDDYLKGVKKKPRSPYEIKAGSYISAALITGINSDLPGSVNAQVTESVYDTVTGNYLLIPQGSKLVGDYNSSLTFGQKRVQVVWNRIIFPDGASLNLERMQGVDISGYSGFQDKVDNHYLRIYGNAVLLSLMGAGYDILNKKAEQSNDPRETVAASVGQKLADVSAQTMQKNMDVQPTLVIDPGYKFKIIVMKDMILEKIDNAQGTLSYSK